MYVSNFLASKWNFFALAKLLNTIFIPSSNSKYIICLTFAQTTAVDRVDTGCFVLSRVTYSIDEKSGYILPRRLHNLCLPVSQPIKKSKLNINNKSFIVSQ